MQQWMEEQLTRWSADQTNVEQDERVWLLAPLEEYLNVWCQLREETASGWQATSLWSRIQRLHVGSAQAPCLIELYATVLVPTPILCESSAQSLLRVPPVFRMTDQETDPMAPRVRQNEVDWTIMKEHLEVWRDIETLKPHVIAFCPILAAYGEKTMSFDVLRQE